MTKTIDLITDGISVAVQESFNNSVNHGFWLDYSRILEALDTICPDLTYSRKYTLDTKLHKIALIHSELGEATEGVRKPHPDEHCPEFTSEEVEMADALIRIFDYAGAFELRLAQAVIAKMAYNASRPFMHGKGA